jgi:GNAT superfamily N-acetyltransferase
MKDLLIRLADASEHRMLEDLQLRASLTNAGDHDALLAHPDAIDLPLRQITEGRVFVAEWQGAIVGFAALEPRADGDTEVDGLFVDLQVRRRGIGRLLIDHCAAAARARESPALHVIGNPHAESFYAACGFSLIGASETRFGTGLLMRMTL